MFGVWVQGSVISPGFLYFLVNSKFPAGLHLSLGGENKTKTGRSWRERLVVCFLITPAVQESHPDPEPWCCKLAADSVTGG